MINLLMCNPTIVLQYIVVLGSGGLDERLQYRLHLGHQLTNGYGLPWRRRTNQNLGKVIIGDISEFLAVILGDDELLGRS